MRFEAFKHEKDRAELKLVILLILCILNYWIIRIRILRELPTICGDGVCVPVQTGLDIIVNSFCKLEIIA